MNMRYHWLCWLFLGALLGLSGCANREHIRDDFGKENRAWYRAQRVHARAAADTPSGLDSEEAALIHAQHRKSMGGGGERVEPQQRVLVLGESKPYDPNK